MYDFILNFKIKQHGAVPKGIFQTPSPLQRYSLYKQREELEYLPVFGRVTSSLLCL